MGKKNRGPGLLGIEVSRRNAHWEDQQERNRFDDPEERREQFWLEHYYNEYGYDRTCGINPGHDPVQRHKDVAPREEEAQRVATSTSKPIQMVVAPASKKKQRRFLLQQQAKQHNESEKQPDIRLHQDEEVATTSDTQEKPSQKGPEKLSRKERKRRAAKLHAATHELFCDTVIEHGPVMEHELVVPDFVAKPLAKIPADVVTEVLLPYLPCSDILTLMKASVGVNTLLKGDDSIWENLFKVQDRSREANRRFTQLKNRHGGGIGTRVPWSQVVRHVNKLNGASDPDTAAKRAALRQASFESDGATQVRRVLREKTSAWETQNITVYIRKSDGKAFPFSPPLVKRYLGYNRFSLKIKPVRCTSLFTGETFWRHERIRINEGPIFTYERAYCFDFNVKYMRRSEAFPKQYACPHHAVVLDTTRHWFRCLDCHLYTHATFTAPGIWHEDDSNFWHEDE